MAVALILAGLGIYLMLWFDHEVLPNPSGAGEWRSAPRQLRRIVRRGKGPVLFESATIQLAAFVMFAVGLLHAVRVVAYPISAIAAYLIVGAWLVALVTWLVVGLRARRRQ